MAVQPTNHSTLISEHDGIYYIEERADGVRTPFCLCTQVESMILLKGMSHYQYPEYILWKNIYLKMYRHHEYPAPEQRTVLTEVDNARPPVKPPKTRKFHT